MPSLCAPVQTGQGARGFFVSMTHTMQLGDRTLAYLDQGEGPVLLFGHSFLWTPGMWRDQVTSLSTSYRCIVPALWSHGESGPVGGEGVDLESLTDDMVSFLDSLGVDRFSAIGLSVGGMWAARLAHRLGERMDKLVLMDTDLGQEPPESQARFLGMLQLAETAGCLPEPLVDACLPFFFSDASLAGPTPCVHDFRQSLLSWDPKKLPGVVAMGRAIFTRPDFTGQLPQIQCPTLVVVGEQDRSRPPHEARHMADLLPHSRLEVIPDAGHIPPVEQPDRVTSLLRKFLSA